MLSTSERAAASISGKTRYVRPPLSVQVYTNGDVCDETGQPRHTILVIACPLKGQQPLFVSETSPCAYLVILYHAELCNPWTEITEGKAELAFQDEL